MILVEPNVELLKTSKTYEEMLDDIARAARICYASEGGKKTSLELIHDLYKRHHGRPFEFGTLYMSLRMCPTEDEEQLILLILSSPWTRRTNYEDRTYITTNMRVVKDKAVELLGDSEDTLQFALDFAKKYFQWTIYHHSRPTFHWTISRVTADSFRTHTMISSLMQSTRYCNYSLGKFGGQLQICRPCWMKHSAEEINSGKGTQLEDIYTDLWWYAEKSYNAATYYGHPAQLARGVLPLDVKTEFLQCAYDSDWMNFFDQRAFDSTGPAHPDAKFIATKAYQLFVERDK